MSEAARMPIPHSIEPIPCRIQVMSDDETFRLDGGDKALSLFVRDRYGHPADLVAWFNDRPGEWWLRKGDETPVLGARQLAGSEMTAAPLPIYPTPLAWLEAGGDGICILDWDMKLAWLFDGLTLDVGHLQLHVAQALAERLRTNFRSFEPRIVGLKEDERE